MDTAAFFGAIDDSYNALFNSEWSWEETACAVLLSYDNVCRRDPVLAHVDIRKYGIMHALRWGRNAPSQVQTVHGDDAQLGREILRAADELRRRGSQYVGVFACRQLLNKKVFSILRYAPSSIEATVDPDWFSYQQLDDVLDEADADDASVDIELLDRLRNDVVVAFETTTSKTLEDFYLSESRLFCRHRIPAGAVFSTSYRMPSNWECLGVSLEAIRQIGVSLFLLATMHTCLTNSVAVDDCDIHRLLTWRKTNLVSFLADSSNLPTSTVQQIIALLIYQRDVSPPDIALQPFLQVNDDCLVASPWLLLSSNYERNWLSLLARTNKKEFDDCSEAFANAMSRELVSWLENAGFMAKAGLRLRDGSTDLDLIVWSPAERFLLTAELKVMIQTADVMEVLNRGESTARVSIEKQLPKHKKALDENCMDIVERAFGKVESVAAYDSLLVCRGFCGTSRLPKTFPCVDERLFKKAITQYGNLVDAVTWLRSYLWLPVSGRDFAVETITIRAPNGFTITFPEMVVNKSVTG